ncbi:MAG: hypothetical protein V7K55_08955 [Nostoc sp.]|uniref:hypothetical protein n=1 Tax=Nostoc sp. TaxID=1180 RepID=UPI002FFD577B
MIHAIAYRPCRLESDRQTTNNSMEIVSMSKPVGYFTSYTINDGSLLDSLQERYGSTFELMTKREKLFLISVWSGQFM